MFDNSCWMPRNISVSVCQIALFRLWKVMELLPKNKTDNFWLQEIVGAQRSFPKMRLFMLKPILLEKMMMLSSLSSMMDLILLQSS